MKHALIARASFRFYRRHPWQLLLAIAGIALGIAVFVGIQLANDSARRAFEASSTALRGQTTHRLLPLAGMLDESIYLELKADARFVDSAPLIELPSVLVLPDGRRIDAVLSGFDPIEEIAVRGPSGLAAAGANTERLLTEPGAILLPQETIDRFSLATGVELELIVGERGSAVELIGGGESGGSDGSLRIGTDIATAQELAGREGALSRIDLRLSPAAAADLAAAPPAGTVLVSAGAEDIALGELTRAFNTNLTALGLLALVVGMFLIYSTISFTIVQRWRSLAVLRALGLTRAELLGKLLGEALAIGAVGTLLGLLLGRGLSTGLLELVLRTLDDLYFRRALAAAEASRLIYLLGAVLGIGATLASALLPAWMASQRDVDSRNRGRLERGAVRLTRRFAFAAVPTIALAAGVLALAPRSLIAAFFALLLVLIAGAMLVPLATTTLMRLVETPVAWLAGLPGRLAVRGVSAALSRTGVATAALTVAVATVMSIGLMIASFRGSLIEWIDATVTADLYVDLDPATSASLAPALATLTARPGITGLGLNRTTRVTTPQGPFELQARAPGPEGYGIEVTLPAGTTADVLLASNGALLIAEPLAYRLQLGPGDSLELATPDGLRPFAIAGVYRDYATAGSELIMALPDYQLTFDDDSLSRIGVHLDAGADQAAETRAIREILGLGGAGRIRSTARIRELSLAIFDQTFRITEVLRLLAALVAFLGILSAVMALELEREREFAVLRSLGMSIRELFVQSFSQTGLLGLTAGLAALPLGAALAWLLVHVINRRSFGWTMDFVLTPGVLVSGLSMAIAAALLAGIYPAFVGARADMGLAWRDD